MQMRLKAEYERKQLAEERKLWGKQVLAKKRAALGAKTVSETTGWEIPHQSLGGTTYGAHCYGPSSQSDRLGMPEIFTSDALAFPIILC